MSKITTDDLAEFLRKQTPLTFDVFDQAVEKGDVQTQFWCRGRVDALFQIHELIDPEGLELLRADWTHWVSGESWTDDLGNE